MELKEEMYVRTLDGISKIIEVINDEIMSRFVNEDRNVYFADDMMCNPSYDIIDLIKVGDYVNGYKVMGFEDKYYDYDKDDYIDCKSIVLGNEEGMYQIPKTKIESIVTKEQFEQMSYKVGE